MAGFLRARLPGGQGDDRRRRAGRGRRAPARCGPRGRRSRLRPRRRRLPVLHEPRRRAPASSRVLERSSTSPTSRIPSRTAPRAAGVRRPAPPDRPADRPHWRRESPPAGRAFRELLPVGGGRRLVRCRRRPWSAWPCAGSCSGGRACGLGTHGLELSAHVHANIPTSSSARRSTCIPRGSSTCLPSRVSTLSSSCSRRDCRSSDGRAAALPDRPGLGLDWDWDAVERYRRCLAGAAHPPHASRWRTPAAADGPFSSPWDAPLVLLPRSRSVSCNMSDPDRGLAHRSGRDRAAPPSAPRAARRHWVHSRHVHLMPEHRASSRPGARVQRHVRRTASGAPGVGSADRGRLLDGPATSRFRTIGVAHGREVHGQPKKLASLKLETRGDLIVGEVERNGITVLTATLPYKQRVVDAAELHEHFDFRENINYKLIPDIATDGPRSGSPRPRTPAGGRAAMHECWHAASARSSFVPTHAGRPSPAAAGARTARRVLLARRLHARGGPRPARLPRRRGRVSGHLVVLDAPHYGDIDVEVAAGAPYGVTVRRTRRTASPEIRPIVAASGGRLTACSSSTGRSAPTSSRNAARAGV